LSSFWKYISWFIDVFCSIWFESGHVSKLYWPICNNAKTCHTCEGASALQFELPDSRLRGMTHLKKNHFNFRHPSYCAKSSLHFIYRPYGHRRQAKVITIWFYSMRQMVH